MRKILAGGVALAFAGAGAIFFAAPSSAQEEIPELSADLAPNPVEPGGAVTVSSIDPCLTELEGEPVYLAYSVVNEAGDELVTNIEYVDPAEVDGLEDVIDETSLIPDAATGWTASFAASSAEGRYAFVGYCMQAGEGAHVIEPPAYEPVVLNPCVDAPYEWLEENFELCLVVDEGGEPEPGEAGEWQWLEDNPCDDDDFANDPANEGLCGEVDFCEYYADDADVAELCEPIEIEGVLTTGYYVNEFVIRAPAPAPPSQTTAPVAVPVPATPAFTG